MIRSNSSPLITVYVANHNYKDYLVECLESIASQSFDDFELLIIDDGSSDASWEIIQKFSSTFRCQSFQVDFLSLPLVANLALKRAKGTYILRVDADDFLHPHALRVMADEALRFKADVVVPSYWEVDEQSIQLNCISVVPKDCEGQLHQSAPHGAVTMLKRRLLADLDGYDVDGSCQDGFDVWSRLPESAVIRYLSLPLFYYRKHGPSMSSRRERLLCERQKFLGRHSTTHNLKIIAVLPILRAPKEEVSDQTMNEISCLLENLQRQDWCSYVIVSSPDKLIIDAVSELDLSNVEIDERSTLASKEFGSTSLFSVYQALALAHQCDYFLQVSTDLNRVSLDFLPSAISSLQAREPDSLLFVEPITKPCFVDRGDGEMMVLNWENDISSVRVDTNRVYRQVYAASFFSRDNFLKANSFLGSSTMYFEVL